MIRLIRILLLAAATLLAPALASAQDSALVAAKAAGQVGERPDGLIGSVSPSPTPQIRALIDRINAERMRIYAQAAQRNGATLEATRRIYGEQLIRDTPRGQFYMDANQRWVRR